MINTGINTTITIITSGFLGYFVNKIRSYKKQKDKIMEELAQLKENQMMDMKNDLSNKFFIYDSMEEVEDYLVMAFREKCERYFEMGGNTWIHPMYDKSFKWKIKHTGYLISH